MLLIAVFCCFVALSLPQMVETGCSPEPINDPNSTVAMPPVVKALPDLMLMEYNRASFSLHCDLLICSIPSPITYNWYRSKTRDGQGEHLTNIKATDEVPYDVDGSFIYIETGGTQHWDELSGFYWCEAINEKGVATSNKVEVVRSPPFTKKDRLPETITRTGESVHIKMDRDPITDDDIPINMYYYLMFYHSEHFILKPRDEIEGREGRFVIGDDYDLYVLEADASDSLRFGQTQNYYSTSTLLSMRDESKLTVEDTPYDGPPQTGFFDGYTDYVFVEGKPSHFTCIPKKVGKVTFKKNGKEIENLTENEDEDVSRSRYGLWFKKADESHAGTYTCHLEGDDATLTKSVKVVGPPKMTCDFGLFIWETPGSPINMNCDVTSDFFKINEPDLYFNNQPFVEVKKDNENIRFEKTVEKTDKGYKIQVSSKGANQEHDTGVFRLSAKADRVPTRNDVLDKLGFTKDQFDQIQFNNFRVLPFENRLEVAVAVFGMPLRIKPNKTKHLDALIGQKDFPVNAIIYGSPLPDVSWYVDGSLVSEKDINYRSAVRYTVVNDFFIKEVQKSYNVTIEGKQLLGGEVKTVSNSFMITAHEPLIWNPNFSNDINVAVGNESTSLCSVTQKRGTRTGDIEFTWLDRYGGALFNGLNGFKIERSEMVGDDGFSYATSALKFTESETSAFRFLCNATLEANGFPLDRLSKSFTVHFRD